MRNNTVPLSRLGRNYPGIDICLYKCISQPMTQKIAGFDWDDGNSTGVALADIEAAFMAGPDVAPDMKHFGAEQRFIAIGKDKAGRPLFVAFTFRDHKGANSFVPSAPATCTKRRSEPMKHVPKLKTDAAAEAFLEKDLSGLDFSQFKPARFEFQAKDAQINMRLPSKLLAAVKASAKSSGIPYQRFIRETLEHAVGKKRA
jgi:predicted DNA binding CopG/RHH family protein/uncharacterized DUF497 family protein